MSEEELDTLDYAEEMWKVVVHQVKDNVIAIAALWLSKRVLQEVSEAVAAERDACAKVADDILTKMPNYHPKSDWAQQYIRGRTEVAIACAAAIRARGGGIDVQRDDRDDIDWLHTDLEG